MTGDFTPLWLAALEPADHLVIGLYLAAMLWMGFSIARRQRSTDDFFVGGRNLPAWAVGISIFASLLSTITYLGMPGEMFRTGVAFLTRQLPLPLVLAVVWFLWIPFFKRLELTSAYEYLEKRFDYTTRALAAIFCLLLLFGWISVVVLTASRGMLNVAALNLDWWEDADMHVIIISVGLFSVLYTTMGGIRAVIWTDVIQFLVLMFGAFFTMGYIAWNTGSGLSDWLATSQQYKHEAVEWFDWDVRTRSTVFTISLGMFFWFICTHGSNQVALQRYFSVKDTWEARKSYLVSAVASIFIGVTLAGVGIALMHYIQEHPLPSSAHIHSPDAKLRNMAQDNIFPEFIGDVLPAGLRGMVVAALFAAAMSTIDSGSNSASTIVTVDFLRRSSQLPPGSREELRQARLLTALSGIIVVAYTLLLFHISKGTDIITLCQKGFNCFLGALGAVFVLGMFSRRATAQTVVPALLLGELTGVVTSYLPELTSLAANTFGGWWAEKMGGKLVWRDGEMIYAGIPFSTHLVVATSWLVTIITSHLLAFIRQCEATAEQKRLLWWPVVRGNTLEADSLPAPETAEALSPSKSDWQAEGEQA